ncbi:hypothetical protein SDC9_137922 [bioreactor metagenome]|uniref:Uncharacterized protein n=1 Tax=bioreactor metagenome TaxID=1076179 RepID=A0A645DMX4_9ZZZZ
MGNTYTTSSEDKLDVSIKTTAIEKFTYVVIAGRKMLGTKSYYSTLNEAAWTFYSKKMQRHFQKITTYNKNYATSSYMFPDQKAITSFGNGGYIDQPPSIKIGIATFDLY